MDWRREDSTYAVATIIAAAFVVYIIAGNFGLVPAPFIASSPRREPLFTVPVVAAASTQSTAPKPAVRQRPQPASGGVSTPPTAAPRDTTKPTASITSSGGLNVALTSGASVSGTAADGQSGVKQVVVTFDSGDGNPSRVTANLSCRGANRYDCTWSADVPAVAGTYRVTADASDRAGNHGRAGPTDVTVVNVGGAVDGTSSSNGNNGIVGGLIDTVGGLLH